MNNYLGIILLLLFLTNNTVGQKVEHSQTEAQENTKIALTDILGDWYSIDSLMTKISFRQVGNSYVEIEGIKHGVGNYGFVVAHDSIDVNGMALNWPPYDCTLYLQGKNVLEISFYQFYTVAKYSVVYKRR